MRILLAESRPIKKATQQWPRLASAHASLIRETSPPLPKKGFLMSCITRCKPENRAPNSQVLGSTCTPVSCSLHLPLPFRLPPPAGSHKSLPPFKTPAGSCSFCVKFFDKQYPNNKNNNSAAQHTGRGTVGRHSSVPVTFLHFSANGAAPSLASPPPLSTPWLHLPAASKSYIRYMKTFFKSSTKNKIKKIFIEVPRWLLHCGSSGCVGHREVRRAPLKFWSHQTGRRSHPDHTD